MGASCLGLRPPAAMTGGWFPPVQAVSSAGLCNPFLEHRERAFLLGARWRRLFWACERLPSFDVASEAQLHLKQDGLYAGQVGSIDDFILRHVVLPFDAEDGAQVALVKPLQ